ncbi:hypothetical protein MTZ49_10635 [Entomomonas sp. E2T0]|uniref:hypothetical protein n=1 Tax=Entomomonas sp. E2T0 TaxID=2930213 RepID=UPI0022283228|nr:hypothetical protein [Entomomonas sp. E2T0]UYZ83058.1 hypothetical protein MTZ49_10635 [Entomomonas sp. E2T0]
MTIATQYCNSIHLTNAVELDGKISLVDIFLNGVIRVRVTNEAGHGKQLRVTFNSEQTMKLALKHTHWARLPAEANTVVADIHEKGIRVKRTFYRDFDLLSNLSEGMTNV